VDLEGVSIHAHMSGNHELALRVLREAAHMYDATRGSGGDDAESTDLQTLAARLTKQVLGFVGGLKVVGWGSLGRATRRSLVEPCTTHPPQPLPLG